MRKIIMAGLCALALSVVTGCGSDSQRYDAQGTDGIVTTHELDFKDYQIAAEKCINEMLRSGQLDRQDGRKNILMVNKVLNSTSQHIDVDILTQKIREALTSSGKVAVTTAVGGRGAEDTATRDVRDLEDDDTFNQKTVKKPGTAIAPDLSLNGKIIQIKKKKGRVEESYFKVFITITDLETGLSIWEGGQEIMKQETKPLIGF